MLIKDNVQNKLLALQVKLRLPTISLKVFARYSPNNGLV